MLRRRMITHCDRMFPGTNTLQMQTQTADRCAGAVAARSRVSLRLMLVVGCVILATGCASSRIDSDRSRPSTRGSDVELRVRAEYDRWKGTPHVLGGNSPRGMDCSAFVQRVFTDAFDVRLPRTTESQVTRGRRISRDDLQPGDLVFFRPAKTRHVGIYLNDGEFAHASSSEGVTISNLDLEYWRDAYWMSRRILSGDSRSSADISDRTNGENEASSLQNAGGGRVGW